MCLWVDGENLYIRRSENIRVWNDGVKVQEPRYPWEFVQLGNCGSPIETEAGWKTLIPSMGFPAGKTKTMVVDTPQLPPGVRRLRIVASQWLSWDRIAWTDEIADDEALLVSRLEPRDAELRFRGFSEIQGLRFICWVY